jgi:argininosuccinate lyase
MRILKPDRKASIGESYEHFKQATANSQADHGMKVHVEIISVIEQTQHSLSAEGKAQILQLVIKYVSEDLYMSRYQVFEEAMARQVGRWGMKLDLTGCRPDLVKSLYHVGSVNFVRQAIGKLADDLELVVQRKAASPSAQPQSPEGRLEQANRLVKLEPNIFGIGFNLNYLIRRWFGRKE